MTALEEDDMPGAWAGPEGPAHVRFHLGYGEEDSHLLSAVDGWSTFLTPMANGWWPSSPRRKLDWDLECWEAQDVMREHADPNRTDDARVAAIVAVWMQSAAHEVFELLHVDGKRWCAPHPRPGLTWPNGEEDFLELAQKIVERTIKAGHNQPDKATRNAHLVILPRIRHFVTRSSRFDEGLSHAPGDVLLLRGNGTL